MVTATSDPVGTALASLGAGAVTGAVVITVGLIAFRMMAGGVPEVVDAPYSLIPISLFVGIAVAVVCAWLLSRPIADYFRRGLTAVLAVFAALMLAGLAVPADMVWRGGGLAVYLALLLAADVWLLLRARRAGTS